MRISSQLLAVCCLASALTITASSGNNDENNSWPSYKGGAAHQGYKKDPTVDGKNITGAKLMWNITVNPPPADLSLQSFLSHPVQSQDGKVYIVANYVNYSEMKNSYGTLVTIDGQKGIITSKTNLTGGQTFYSVTIGYKELIYITSPKENQKGNSQQLIMEAIDPATKAKVWAAPIHKSPYFDGPVANDAGVVDSNVTGLVYYHNYSHIIAVNASTGHQVFLSNLTIPGNEVGDISGYNNWVPTVYQGNRLFFAAGNDGDDSDVAITVVGEVDAKKGHTIWHHSFLSSHRTSRALTVASDVAVVFMSPVNDDATVVALDINKNGSILWKAPFCSHYDSSTDGPQPVSDGKLVYIPCYISQPGEVLTYDLRTGKGGLTFTTNDGEGGFSELFVTDDYLFGATIQNSLYGFNKLTGKQVFKAKLVNDDTQAYITSMIYRDGILYATLSGSLAEFSYANLMQLLAYQLQMS